MANTLRDAQFIEFQVEHVRELILQKADKLRQLADEVERHANFKEGRSNEAVSNVVSSVVWGLANLNLDVLVSAEHHIQEAKDVAGA